MSLEGREPNNYFGGCLLQLAMDRRDRERELTSSLLSILCHGVLVVEQVKLGFTKLLANVEVSLATTFPFG